MNRIFKTREGEVVDPVEYSLALMKQYPKKWDDLRIYIGTDSQNNRYNTQYVCVIAYRFPGNRGAHIIFSKESVKKIRDINEKLRGEVDISMEVATFLHSQGVKIHCIDFDFNQDDMMRSHQLVKYAQGWASGMGFESTCKPEEQLASRMADNLVKGKSLRSERKFYRKSKKKQRV